MLEFLYEALRPVNLPFTALMGMVTIYWILVGLGAMDFHSEPSLDVGDVGHDVHVDGHAEVHHGGEVSHDVGAVKAILQFLHFGDMPSMIILSVMALSFWTCSMLGNHYFNGDGSFLRTALLFLPNLVITGLVTKVATMPLKRLFKELNRDVEEYKPVVGRTCTILTSEVTDRFGQAQVDTSGAPIVINVRTYGEATFSKGESALIIKEDKENNIFTVAKLTTTTEQQQQLQEPHL